MEIVTEEEGPTEPDEEESGNEELIVEIFDDAEEDMEEVPSERSTSITPRKNRYKSSFQTNLELEDEKMSAEMFLGLTPRDQDQDLSPQKEAIASSKKSAQSKSEDPKRSFDSFENAFGI